MSRIMFIDGSHREQIRVAVTEKGRVTEFDIESFDKKQTIGNIYLAKVTRVEPSLQAAFVEYGSGRQGFLSFSEIHPDYYQIPLEDRKRLLEEAAAFYNNQNDDDDTITEDDDIISEYPLDDDNDNAQHHNYDITESSQIVSDIITDQHITDDNDDAIEDTEFSESKNITVNESDINGDNDRDNSRKSLSKKPRLPRYKIQEVIKKRQILLIQVIKSERGNKGAALTTYLSLAGRYCVLMPNTARGGGISRKITNVADRQKLRSTIKELQVPDGMGLIIRTAGLQRTKVELRRDYEYLLRLWDNVRQLTMSSIAPALVYEEGNLIKRALRDVYTRDTSKIFVQGEEIYKEARDIMKMIMPSVVRYIHHYHDPLPLFSRYQIERQLDELSLSEVTLKSGGYLVINHTEALIAIDINSGKSTNAYSIEETALRTNLEAAEEIARQLRLRDLAGLIVIDFIDMEDYNNVRAIERKMRDCLKSDKARLQITPISTFGLMEMTRQRLRPAMKDLMAVSCDHCQGMGFVPSLETSALRVLRAIFEEISQKPVSDVTLTCSIDIAHYLLNKKRKELLEVEKEYELSININGSSKCAHLEYDINSELKDPAQISRVPRPYQEDDYEAQILDEEPEDKPEADGVAEDDSAYEARGRGRNNKRRRPHKRADKEEKSITITDDSDVDVDSTNEHISDKSLDNRHDNKRSKFTKKRSRFADRFQAQTDIYVTESGNEVIIENPVSVRHNTDTISEYKETEKSNKNDIDNDTIVSEKVSEKKHKNVKHKSDTVFSENPQEVTENVIIENRNSVKNIQTTYANQPLLDIDDEVITKTEIDSVVHDDVSTENIINTSVVENKPSDNTNHEALSQSNNTPITNDAPPVCEEQKSARRGWWRNRFGL